MIFSLAILAVVLSYTWLIEPTAPRWTAPIPIALVLILAIGHAIRNGDWGLAPRAFVPALWRSAAVTLTAGLGIALAGVVLGTWHSQHDAWTSLALLIPWGLGQQFALQTVFLRESRAAVGPTAGVCLAAALFAALHLPNPFLSAMTLAGALAWCWIYDRHPNLLPLALSHALLTLAILHAFDEAMAGHLRVGAAYLRLR
jgi:membrane protease YdiL (CAAX protease family)